MELRRRTAVLGAAALALVSTAGCGALGGTDPEATAREEQESAWAAAATAAPGTYGAPVDPSLPNPTGVATDAPLPAPPSSTVPVVVAYAGWEASTAAVEVNALVPGLVESGGVCRLTLDSGDATAQVEGPAEQDAASMSCPLLAVPRSELSAGTWQVTVDYESPSASGRSTPLEVVVP